MISKRFFEEVFVTEIYKPVRDLGIELDAVIDLGSCTGEFALWVYHQAKRVYAIEPDPHLFGQMKENVSDFKNIIPVELAISDTNDGAELYDNGNFGGKSIVNKTRNYVEVRSRTLNTFLEENGIDNLDCLKIDIESGEKLVFESSDFPLAAPKIRFIIGEVHSDYGFISTTLRKHGFRTDVYQYGFTARKI